LVGEIGDFGSQSWFEFQGLTPGGSYNLTGFSEAGSHVGGFKFFDDSGTPGTQLGRILDPSENGGVDSMSINAPADGNLVAEVFAFNEHGGDPFQLNISVNRVEGGPVEGGSKVPEPSTVGGVGLGLGSLALAWRRRRPR
jgi:hypothetical protein